MKRFIFHRFLSALLKPGVDRRVPIQIQKIWYWERDPSAGPDKNNRYLTIFYLIS